LDLGLSSHQFEKSGRGFSFQKDEPLTMTFRHEPREEDVTAVTILNEWQEDTIEIILRGFGEERYSKKIARSIIEARKHKAIQTTEELVNIILEATPKSYHHRKIHPATKTFQALRIAVNDELGALQEALQKSFLKLKSNGRIAVISFHSLEDRIVKNFSRNLVKAGEATTLTKKPLQASSDELRRNRRARSAKLRVLVKK
jgi:16S rRNA (cytosine1402-N4)-methyltransferase